MVYSFGQMAHDTRAPSKTTIFRALEGLCMQMQTFMKVTGSRTKRMAMESLSLGVILAIVTKGTGSQINNTAKEKKHIPMALSLTEHTCKDKKMARVNFSGLMAAHTKAA